MAADPLSPAVCVRFCIHLIEVHASAVVAYARHYGGISEAKTATMRKVGPEAMELEVDGQPVLVPFDHPLSDSEDAHRTLVAMLRAMPRPNDA